MTMARRKTTLGYQEASSSEKLSKLEKALTDGESKIIEMRHLLGLGKKEQTALANGPASENLPKKHEIPNMVRTKPTQTSPSLKYDPLVLIAVGKFNNSGSCVA
jgi:hypothetical protein